MITRAIFSITFFFLAILQPDVPTAAFMPVLENGIRTIDSLGPIELVRDVFVKGSCVNIDNIQAFGPLKGLGYFENGTSTIGIERGIVISSGNIENANGMNQDKETTTAFGIPGFDPDLRKIATNALFDVAGLEFEFVPQKEIVSFRYVFASEEYCEYVNSVFNDVFGFFVSGPGINGEFENNGIQVALVPDTDEFVSINNVNHAKNDVYYIKNETREDAQQCNIVYSPQRLELITFDGFTTVLTATFKVIPCERYKIRLLVGDVADDQLDSAVFLEAKSFDIGPEVELSALFDNPVDEALYEGCNAGRLVFRRTDEQRINEPVTVSFRINPDRSTVSAGVDLAPLPASITIPAGQQTASIPVTAIPDGLPESKERMVVELDYPCKCRLADTTQFILTDYSDLQIAATNVDLCLDQEGVLQPTILGGKPPYSYLWDDGSDNPMRVIPVVSGTDVFAITVSDDCGGRVNTIFDVGIKDTPVADIGGFYEWCDSQPLSVPVELTGAPPWSLTYQIDTGTFTVNGILESPFLLPVEKAGTIRLINFSDAGCTGITNGEAEVQSIGIDLQYAVKNNRCINENKGEIILDIKSPTDFSVEWDSLVNNSLNPTDLASGNYRVRVSNAAGCFLEEVISVLAPTPEESFFNNCAKGPVSAQVYIPNAFSPDGDGINDRFEVFISQEAFLQLTSFKIFDRWGNQIYAQQITGGSRTIPYWDGTYNGKRVSSGVYVYTFTLEDPSGKQTQLSGSVILVR